MTAILLRVHGIRWFLPKTVPPKWEVREDLSAWAAERIWLILHAGRFFTAPLVGEAILTDSKESAMQRQMGFLTFVNGVLIYVNTPVLNYVNGVPNSYLRCSALQSTFACDIGCMILPVKITACTH